MVRNNLKDILPIWQPVGYSTHLIAKRISEKLNSKTSHTGTLDPMAEGVIIVLAGEERRKKHEYASWLKEYEFEIVFGISTDTLDGLGIPEIDKRKFSTKALDGLVSSFIGEYKQKYPKFSAKKILGKPLHFFARNKTIDDIKVPFKDGEIKEFEVLSLNKISLKEIHDNVVGRVKKITGDLRQDEVTDSWDELLSKNKPDDIFQIAKFRVVMTKGLYVRGLVRDLAAKLGVFAFTYSIVRTKNGSYTKDGAIPLEDFFGSGFDRNNFVSRGKS